MISSRESQVGQIKVTAQYMFQAACVIIIGLFYMLTLREGHDWGSDFALYIAHAKNIALGLPYAETGYIPNPYSPNLSPVAYPPVFPFLLSPIYRAFGLDMHVMKIAVISIMLCMLVVFMLYARRSLKNDSSVYLCFLVVGFSPWLWDIRDQVISEFPFMLFLLAALLLSEKALALGGQKGRKWLFYALAAGVSIYLAYGTRTLGGLLVPVIIFFDFQRQRKISLPTIIIIITFSLLFFVHYHNFRSEKAYSSIISLYTREVFLKNLIEYSVSMVSYWYSPGVGRIAAVLVFLGTFLLFVIGWINSLLSKNSIGSIFILLYVMALILAPVSGGVRYLTPIIPLYLLYIFVGSEVLGRWIKVRQGSAVPLLIASVILVANAFWYKDHFRDAISDGPYTRSSLELFAFVKEHTDAKSIFIFRKPRAFALYTGRKATPPTDPGLQGLLWKHIKNIGVTHVIIKYAGSSLIDANYQQEWVEKNRGLLEVIFENDQFRLYKIVE